MSISWPPKGPNEVLDYQIDWSGKLGADTISASSWTVPSGITKDSDTYSSTATEIWLSGGTSKTAYTLTNEITTALGRTIRQSVWVYVKPM